MATGPAVPLVDLALPEEDAAAQVAAACRSPGFFYVTGHGVPEGVVEAHFDASRRYFALPLEEKMRVKADVNNRGYTPLAEEVLDPEQQSQGDTKEGYYIGREVPLDSAEAALPLHGPNQWPDEAAVPGYRAAMEAYFDACTALGRRVLRLIALALQVPPGFFDARFSRPMLFLRPLHYTPQLSAPEEGVYGAGAHSDYGMLTLLATDGTPGLQIEVGGAWRDVPPIAGAFVVNLGDMLERWTNGLFVSTRHRVLSTAGRDRYSTAFFMEPNFDTLVECLPQCCSAQRPAAYPPTTSGQHLLDKYAQTHTQYSGYTGKHGQQEGNPGASCAGLR